MNQMESTKLFNNRIDNIRISEEQTFLTDLRTIVANGRRKGYEAVNQIIVVCNWLIGRRIVVQEQQGKERAEYGKHVIDIASKYLTEEFGKGYSTSNLRNYRQFYLMFGNLIPNLPDTFGKLMDTKMNEAEAENWSVRTLHRNISSQYYQRLLITKPEAKAEVVSEMQGLTAEFQKDKLAFLKNPIVAEFLGLPQNTSYTETDLETAQLFAAKYMTFLPKKEELLAEIEYQKQIFLMQKSGQL